MDLYDTYAELLCDKVAQAFEHKNILTPVWQRPCLHRASPPYDVCHCLPHVVYRQPPQQVYQTTLEVSFYWFDESIGYSQKKMYIQTTAHLRDVTELVYNVMNWLAATWVIKPPVVWNVTTCNHLQITQQTHSDCVHITHKLILQRSSTAIHRLLKTTVWQPILQNKNYIFRTMDVSVLSSFC